MKTATIKLEFEDIEIPHCILVQAIRHGLRSQGIIGEHEEVPTGAAITLEKLGRQENGRLLAYAHITIHDAEADAHFKEFYGLEDKDYLEKRKP